MRFAIDPWDPSYGMANDVEDDPEATAVTVELDTELPIAEWSPLAPPPDTARDRSIAFVDGVRRVDARIWVSTGDGSGVDGPPMPGVCASWAAGAVCCVDGVARIHPEAIEVGRSVAAPDPMHRLDAVTTPHVVYRPLEARGPAPEDLWLAVQQEMGRAEVRIAAAVRAQVPDALLVVDGPIGGRQPLDGLVGVVKTHHVAYLVGAPAATLAALRPGERTPVFTITGRYPRHSWYLRLPGAQHPDVPLSGVVRCECPVSVTGTELVELATSSSAVLPRFASAPYKDRRAPQNLTPIAGLERRLRHLLGDPALLYRSLRVAAATGAARPAPGQPGAVSAVR